MAAPTLTTADLTAHNRAYALVDGRGFTALFPNGPGSASFSGTMALPLANGQPQNNTLRLMANMDITASLGPGVPNTNLTGTLTNLTVFEGNTPLETLSISGQVLINGTYGQQTGRDLIARGIGRVSGAFGQDELGFANLDISFSGTSQNTPNLGPRGISGVTSGTVNGHYTTQQLRTGTFTTTENGAALNFE